MSASMLASDILDAVATHYGQGAVLVREVGDSVGFATRRHIDALALGCWASRGLFVHAIEVKRTMRDLKRELALPDKAESVARYCDRMWIAAPEGLVDPDILPEAWGLYEVTARGVRTRKQAKQLEADPLNRKFVMAVARACAQQLTPERKIATRVQDAREAALAEAKNLFGDQATRAEKRATAAERALEDLQRSLGGSPWRHISPEDIGKTVEALNALSRDRGVGALGSLCRSAEEILKHAECIERVCKAAVATDAPSPAATEEQELAQP